MTYDTIEHHISDHVATVTLNRADQLNTLTPHMVEELE